MTKVANSKELIATAHQYHLAGRLVEAEAGYRKALREDAGNANAHYLLGTLFLQQGEPAQAARSIKRAIQLSPGFVEMHVNLSVAYQHLDQHVEAVEWGRRALALNPNNAPSYSNLGHALTGAGDLDAALDAYQNYLRLMPTEAYAHVTVGNAHLALGQMEKAMSAWEDALVFDPHFVAAHIGIAEVLSIRGWFHGARAVLENAIAVKPDDARVQKRLGLLLIQLGELARGWALQDKGRFVAEPDRIIRRAEPPPYWNGASLAGKKILVWTEQGIGDEILHASMLSEVIASAEHTTIECSRRLVPIFSRSFPQADVVGYKVSEAPVTSSKDFDFQIAIASLGCFFRNEFASFPNHRGYSRSDAEVVARLRKAYEIRANGRRIVGISWRSKAGQTSKSAALANLAPILQTPGIMFVNLQYGDCAAELAAVRETLGVEIFHDPLVDSLADMDIFFAQVAAMDLVISSSNTAVHVAGSQNIPVWMLLHHGKAAPYYWFLGREDSPWYPSARIFRARTANPSDSWEIEPSARIAKALGDWMTRALPHGAK